MRLLDLFCGGGGASVGYARAGFEVVGVDLVNQPRYPFEFHQADALEFQLTGFDAIHASPPCQAFSTLRSLHPQRQYADLVAPVRELLVAAGVPYVIENVVGAPLVAPVRLCGSSFGLDIRRHRLFESNVPLLVPPCTHGWQTPRFRSLDRRQKSLATVVGVHGSHNYSGEGEIRKRAMGIDWMTTGELAEAIPPDYCELIGAQLMAYLHASGRAPDDSSHERTLGISASPGHKTGSRRSKGVPAGSASFGHSRPSTSAEIAANSLRSERPRGDRD